MNFKSEHMDYNLGFALTFKCIFGYDFISIFFIGNQYMIHNGKKIWIEKNHNKNFNQQITMDFWMTKFGPYFQKPQSWSFFVGLIFVFSPTCMIKSFLDGHPFIWTLLID
jgi:hypothetical protein